MSSICSMKTNSLYLFKVAKQSLSVSANTLIVLHGVGGFLCLSAVLQGSLAYSQVQHILVTVFGASLNNSITLTPASDGRPGGVRVLKVGKGLQVTNVVSTSLSCRLLWHQSSWNVHP